MDAQLVALRDSIRVRRELPPPATRRALRIAAGVTLDSIASVCHVTRQAVSNWEQGRSAPRGATLARYVEVLNLLRGVEP